MPVERTEADLEKMLSIPDDKLDDFMFGGDSEDETTEDGADIFTEDTDTSEDGTDDTESADNAPEDGSEEVEESVDDEVEDTGEEEVAEEQTELSKVFAPFQANGKTIQVKTEDEAVRLMQMGANYNQKMAGLKPHLKSVRMLEQHGLLEDQDKLNALVAVSKGDRDAIMKLVADNGIDPLDIDIDEAKSYKNTQDYSVSDAQYDFESTVQELAPMESFQLVTATTTEWDDQSKQQIFENPNILRGLNALAEDKELFQKVSDQISTLRALGQVPAGFNDIDVFASVTQQLQQESNEATPAEQSSSKTTAKSKPANAEVVRRKKAAVPSRGGRAASRAQAVNPLSLSDEEFAKAAADGVFDELFNS